MTMTEKEKYKQAFSALHASENISLEVSMMSKKNNSVKKILAVCACAVMLCGVTMTAYAYGDKVLETIFGWSNNVQITRPVDENGEVIGQVVVDMDKLTEPVEIKDGKMYFIVNDEHIDITEQVSATEAYSYNYVDEDGNTHYWLVGLNGNEVDNYGYAEFIKDADGIWAGGYSTRINIEADGSKAQWFESGKASINCPW